MGDHEATAFWNVTPRKLEDGWAKWHFSNSIAEKSIILFLPFSKTIIIINCHLSYHLLVLFRAAIGGIS